MAARLLAPSRNRALVADLPVIANLDVLTQVGSVEYLRGLAKLNFETSLRNEDAIPSVVSDKRLGVVSRSPARGSKRCRPRRRRSWRASSSVSSGSPPRRKHRTTAGTGATTSPTRPIESSSSGRSSTMEPGSNGCSPGGQLELREASSTDESDQTGGADVGAIGSGGAAAVVAGGREAIAGRDPRASSKNVAASWCRKSAGRDIPIRSGGSAGRPAAQVALVIIGRDMLDDERRTRTVDRLTAPLSPEAQEYLNELDRGQRCGS